MPLPGSDNLIWPPEEWRPAFAKFAEYAAWYSGDPLLLARAYGGSVQWRKQHAWWRFWERSDDQSGEYPTRSQLHVPIASDIATINAALLFGEKPTITIADAHVKEPDSDAVSAEERLAHILIAGDVHGRLVSAAESAAAMGGVYLKVDWDRELIDIPLVTVVQADAAIPDWHYGILTGVTLWRDIERFNTTVWRHVERHETTPDGTGIVLHGLYKGTEDRLGVRHDLTAHEYTASFPEVVRLPFKGLGIRYIPNMAPNPLFRGSDLGRSDFQGVEGMFDALDETFSSWMRDIRLGKARIMVPEEYLQKSGDRFLFDTDQEVFTPLDMSAGDRSITTQQFAIRFDEHERTANALIERIVSRAGYSPQTFGLYIDGRADSATALRVRERRTLMTQQRKRSYWESPLVDIAEMLLAVDRAVFNPSLTLFRPSVEMADSLTPDEVELATAVDMVNRAGAASIETLVRMLHVGWDDAQIVAEVERIRAERGLALPDPMQVGIA